MTIPTYILSVELIDQSGDPLVNARVLAKLTNTDVGTAYVVPEEQTAVTDANGIATLALWPNTLGATESRYQIRAWSPLTGKKVLDVMATMVERDAFLHEVADLPCYPGKQDGWQQSANAVQAAADAQTAASAATQSENSALAAAANAEASEQNAQTYADNANSSAQTAADLVAPYEAHLTDYTNPHQVAAAHVPIADAGGNFAATDVEGALAEEADARQLHEADTANPHNVTYTQVGADAAGTAAAAITAHEGASDPHGQYVLESTIGQVNGVASLDAGGKVPSTQLPALALTDVWAVSSEVEQLALTAQEGDVAVRSDLNKSYVHNGGIAGTMADWQELLTPTDVVLSVFGRTGAVTAQSGDYTASQIPIVDAGGKFTSNDVEGALTELADGSVTQLHASLVVSNWTGRTSAASNYWTSVCWSSSLGLFCAAASSGTGNRVMTSPDGINWTARSSAVDNDWQSVCWSSSLGLFCAVAKTGTGNRVMTSPDGINWTARSSAVDNDWQSVCWSSSLGLFCAVAKTGTGNRVMTSPDGTNWTARSSAADNNWTSVCWSSSLGLFCAVANTGTGNRVMTSPDGINWTIRSSAVDNWWMDVCWAPELSLFCAVAMSGTGNRVMTSSDGINWSIRSSAADNYWYSVSWSPELGLFCAVGSNGAGNMVMTSPNGINWTARTNAAQKIWKSVVWSPEKGVFCAVDTSGAGTTSAVMTSLFAW